MNDNLIDWLQDTAPKMYPNVFNGVNDAKIQYVAEQAYSVMSKFTSADKVGNGIFKQLMLLYTAHLMSEINDDDYSSIKAADLSVSFNKPNGNGNSDPYMNELMELLKALGLIDNWRIQIY